ncbi:hypothetical protein RRG08_063093 [Elysia crispata]|uniref:Sulfotransferase n=1 Tax=Elysia crispata TaxID=231223 RepID=A0AAE0YL24_9GAST|nr:hypothetical protein RRG08_063093 [Elysia crispata]
MVSLAGDILQTFDDCSALRRSIWLQSTTLENSGHKHQAVTDMRTHRQVCLYWTALSSAAVLIVFCLLGRRDVKKLHNDQTHKTFERKNCYVQQRLQPPKIGSKASPSLSGKDAGRSRKSSECKPDSPRSVILLTYARSGSSLTSDIISVHPDVFAYYEPFHDLAKKFSSQRKLYRKVFHRYIYVTEIPEYRAAATRLLGKLVTCNYTGLSRNVTLNLHGCRSESTTELYRCVAESKNRTAEQNCLMEAQKKCENTRRVRLVKTIRLPVKIAATLVEKDPCSQLIYLVRDPRGSYYSKTKLPRDMWPDLEIDIQSSCSNLNEDVDALIQLKASYPERILAVRYETIAEQPVATFRRIYNFTGLEFTEAIAEFIYGKMFSKKDGGAFETYRSDPFEACYRWRRKISFKKSSTYDIRCREALSKLGYLPAGTLKDLRNLTRPLVAHRNIFS